MSAFQSFSPVTSKTFCFLTAPNIDVATRCRQRQFSRSAAADASYRKGQPVCCTSSPTTQTSLSNDFRPENWRMSLMTRSKNSWVGKPRLNAIASNAQVNGIIRNCDFRFVLQAHFSLSKNRLLFTLGRLRVHCKTRSTTTSPRHGITRCANRSGPCNWPPGKRRPRRPPSDKI